MSLVRTKHTIKGRHGHVFVMNSNRDMSKDDWKDKLFERECVSAEQAAESDLLQERMRSAWKVSRKYHTCWLCGKVTEEVGGYNIGSTIPLMYEHKKCPGKKK
jgi:hypothetical protein